MAPPPTAWTDQALINPHQASDKASRVQAMFAAIAPRYDLNNRLHSGGRDQAWRRRAVQMAQVQPGEVVVDIACGTGDLAMAFARGSAGRVIGLDFTCDMLSLAQQKAAADQAHPPPSYHAGDAMRLPLADSSAHVVSIAFGIRNVVGPAQAIREFYRVLRPNGRLVILEFTQPTHPLVRRVYNFYFTRIMPRTAALIAADRSGAYRYLPRSVNTFLDQQAMVGLMQDAGFTQAGVQPLTLGIAALYRGVKPGPLGYTHPG